MFLTQALHEDRMSPLLGERVRMRAGIRAKRHHELFEFNFKSFSMAHHPRFATVAADNVRNIVYCNVVQRFDFLWKASRVPTLRG
ncbi:hypothetical protein BSPA111_24950 [Buttiauxella sp. A111]|nr:hypothetical protein BSPA111_24950 [Buttiauxella sp. A111]